MACLMLFSNVASAAETVRPSYKQLTQDELSRECSLTLTYKEGDTVLPATTVNLYKVADMNENLQFTPVEKFKAYNAFKTIGDTDRLEINDPSFTAEKWSALAETLSNSVAGDQNKPEPIKTGTTDATTGEVEFTGLEVGLYLILGNSTVSGNMRYTPTPMLATLPVWNAETNAWSFGENQGTLKFTSRNIGGGGGDPTTLSRSVLKVWDDDGNEDARPASITVDLIRDGAVYRTVTLNAGNNWRYTWTGLSANSDWNLVEHVDSENYTVSYNQQGTTFVVTNTYTEEIDPENPPLIDQPDLPGDPDEPGEPEDPGVEIEDPDVPLVDLPELPQTGLLWWPVPVLAVAGVVMILVGLVRRRDGSYD